MALVASNTETCTIAMARTAGGVPGSFEAMSVAFALASVTTSATAGDAAATSARVRTASHARVLVRRIVCSFLLSFEQSNRSVIDVEAERHAPGVAPLVDPAGRVIAGPLHVAEEPLEPGTAEEAGTPPH